MNKNIRLLVESFFDDEIFNISHDIKQDIEDIGDQYYRYRYFPEDFDELRSLLEQLLEERGKDADLNDIDVSKITTFYNGDNYFGLFEGLDPHNIKIDLWNVSNVINMFSTFDGCKNFNSDLSKWDVSKVKNMAFMFKYCENFNSDLSNWNVSKVEYMRWMFNDCKNFNCDLSKWDVSNVKNMFDMFGRCNSLTKIPNWYK